MTTTETAPVDRAPGANDGGSRCRFCGAALEHTFVDLGMSPLCQTHVTPEQLNQVEPFYPLHARYCGECFLVQLDEYVAREDIFTEYAYFSSFADSWVEHARRYAEAMTERLGLGGESLVVELASNDGYLLQHFVERGIPCFGVEPAANVAEAARARGVETVVEFFGREVAADLAATRGPADLVLGNNVLAQVPDLNDFVGGIRRMLKPRGVVTIEFPHLLNLIQLNQFDTIYHEHFSYFWFSTAERIFAAHGMTLFDVEELPTHGGSLRIFGRPTEDESRPITERVLEMRRRERDAGYDTDACYASYGEQVRETKRRILEFLIEARRAGKRVAGYGAPGKGNTLLNYCGIRTDFLDFTVDRNPYKQGKYTPGTRIPILHPDAIREARPDYLFILPWNLKDEIVAQHAYIREWGGQFVVPIPELAVYR